MAASSMHGVRSPSVVAYSEIAKKVTVVECCLSAVAEMMGAILDLRAIMIRQTRD
jgi:hypothetical protein